MLQSRGSEIRHSGHAHCHQATTGAKMAFTHTNQGQILAVGTCRCLEKEVQAGQIGPDHSGVKLGTDSCLIPMGEVISTANSLVLNTRPWENNPQTHDAKNVAANDILMSYSVLRTTECVCLAGASDILSKFVDSPGYSRHNGAIGRQNRQDAPAMHTRCP